VQKYRSFAAERTLGGLVKWLRLMGFDTVSENELSTQAFQQQVGGERVFLTRTRHRFQRACPSTALFVRADNPMDQLRQIIEELEITEKETVPFSRCARCNSPIEIVDKEEALGAVPDHIYNTHHSFSRCRHCDRMYWTGSHVSRSREILKRLFEATRGGIDAPYR
jgi:uncharacterized protein with PIN domain